MPLVLPHNLMHFVEVLSFNYSNYEAWYDALNLGFRVAPTDGTDYPCAGSLPGQERFYTKIEGEFSYENWLEGVRKGRTFVTTGPLLEFSINGKDIGSEVVLDSAGEVILKGKVQFNKAIDNFPGLEVIENGEVIYSIPNVNGTREFNFKIKHKIKASSWIAVRGYSETPAFDDVWRDGKHITAVHSAPIYITLKNGPPLTDSTATKIAARTWMAKLNDLEKRLSALDLNYLEREGGSKKQIAKNRKTLLSEIQHAKEFFSKLLD